MQNKIDACIAQGFEAFTEALNQIEAKKNNNNTFVVPKSSLGQLLQKQKGGEKYVCVLTFTPPADEVNTAHFMASLLQKIQQHGVNIPDDNIKIIDREKFRANPKNYTKVTAHSKKETATLPIGKAVENTIFIWGPPAFQLVNQYILNAAVDEVQIEFADESDAADKAAAAPEISPEEIEYALNNDAELKALQQQLAKETQKQKQLEDDARNADKIRQQHVEKEKLARKNALMAQLREAQTRTKELEQRNLAHTEKQAENPRAQKK